ncbi:MAG TPA: fatty acid desaturase [Longimicrobiales bacterium]|nr:fatty acid desaturase [Longimicrobiales bacterium]
MPGFGFMANSWWIPVVWVIVCGHITNLCVTLYLHRSATHEGVKFAPPVEHFMRFWLWLTTGITTVQWVACHRKHHAFSDREGDPHSPVQEGVLEIVFGGVFFYKEAVRDKDMLEKYGRGCPTDWVEKNFYNKRTMAGLLSMLALDLVLFGLPTGLIVWSCMAVWIPIFGNVINGIGHAYGYRNFDTKDSSRNIIPLGLWIVGEELHNNHHADPKSATFRAKWYEFDIGWVYIKLLSWVKLAEIIYARQLTAKEFTQKYYTKAADAASSYKASAEAAVSGYKASAGAAIHAAADAAESAAGAARDALAPRQPAVE